MRAPACLEPSLKAQSQSGPLGTGPGLFSFSCGEDGSLVLSVMGISLLPVILPNRKTEKSPVKEMLTSKIRFLVADSTVEKRGLTLFCYLTVPTYC